MPTPRQEGLQATKALTNRAAVGRMQTRCLTPAVVSGRSGLKGLGLKPHWGKLTVRNFRGGAGDVTMGAGLRPASKGVDKPPDPKVGAPALYPATKTGPAIPSRRIDGGGRGAR